ncbi:unnamed protein product, partial [Rotaria sp. Silwood2]
MTIEAIVSIEIKQISGGTNF